MEMEIRSTFIPHGLPIDHCFLVNGRQGGRGEWQLIIDQKASTRDPFSIVNSQSILVHGRRNMKKLKYYVWTKYFDWKQTFKCSIKKKGSYQSLRTNSKHLDTSCYGDHFGAICCVLVHLMCDTMTPP